MTQEFYGATVKAQHAINKLLSLPASGREQDWEVELANPNRIEDMLEAASIYDLNYEERCALLLILIASIEEYTELYKENIKNIEHIKNVINLNSDVKKAMIFYWIDMGRATNEDVVRSILELP